METLGMTPLKVGEPFLEKSRWQSRAKPRPRLGRCRDWTGGTYGASYGEGTVQTTNVFKGGGESRSGRLIRRSWVRSPQGPPGSAPLTLSTVSGDTEQ